MQTDINNKQILFDNICKYLKREVRDPYNLSFSHNRVIIKYKNLFETSIEYNLENNCFIMNNSQATETRIFTDIWFYSQKLHEHKAIYFSKYFNLLQKSNLI